MPRYIRYAWLIGVSTLTIVGLFSIYTPIRNSYIRLLIIAMIVAWMLLGVVKTWRWHGLGKGALAFSCVVSGYLFYPLELPRIDREAFVSQLKYYNGCPYVWGGERYNGIDCSGLIRMALAKQYLYHGHVNAWFHLWLWDASAQDIPRKYDRIFGPASNWPSIKVMDNEAVSLGSIAVTADGVHILAYIGDDTWIQANPDIGRVTESKMNDNESWLEVPVVVFEPRH